MPPCADCGAQDVPTSDSPKQQPEGVPPEQQFPATPRPLCSTCMGNAYSIEYGQDQSGGEAPARPNPGDVPAMPW